MKNVVLIVDDERSVREALEKILRSFGYEAVAAGTGLEALAADKQRAADLVLLDLNMPGLSGWETLAGLNARNPLRPVVILTARPNQLEQASAARVAALMEKPFDVPLLLETIERLIQEPVNLRRARMTGESIDTSYFRRATTTAPHSSG